MFFSISSTTGCALFDVECDVHDGFKISINNDCKRTEEYKSLPTDNAGLFVYAESFENEPEKLIPANLENACKFEGADEVNIGFDECGESVFTPSNGDELGFYTVYVIHQQSLGGISISEMDENEIICKFSDAQLNTARKPDSFGRVLRPGEIADGLSIANNDEETGAHLLKSDTLVNEFDLEMVIGIDQNGAFTKLDSNDKVDNGQLITIKLEHRPTTYAFTFLNCKSSDGKDSDGKIVKLYDDFCPKAGYDSILGLTKKNPTEFSIQTFRIGNSDTITFTCNVHAYPSQDSVPTTCSRKRRSEVQKSEDEESQLSVTLNIAKENLKIKQESSATISSMCNIIFVVANFLFL